MIRISILLIIFNINIAIAMDVEYCQERNLGWHFYCDPEEEKQKSVKLSKKNISPLEQLENIKKELESKKALAILYPTKENIISYMEFQKQQLDRSSLFADMWRRVNWQTPNLDYSLKRPVGSLAKKAWIDMRAQKINKVISNINKRYGIFFIYSSKCVFCHKYSPILKSFTDKFNLKIKAISLDGYILPAWPNSLIDKGHVKKMGLTSNVTPATIIYDNKYKKIIPIGFGLLTHDQLEQRIFILTKIGLGDDF